VPEPSLRQLGTVPIQRPDRPAGRGPPGVRSSRLDHFPVDRSASGSVQYGAIDCFSEHDIACAHRSD